jgi:hypothetical protein
MGCGFPLSAQTQAPQVEAPQNVTWTMTSSAMQKSGVPFTVTASYSDLNGGLAGCCPQSLPNICRFIIKETGNTQNATKLSAGSVQSSGQFTLTAKNNKVTNYTLQIFDKCFGTSGSNRGQANLVVGKTGHTFVSFTIIVNP